MASYLPLVLLATALFISISSARVIPAEPVSLMLDAYGNPVLFLREKRAPLTGPILPHRAMMFTGYYRPTRRSSAGNQAAGVFAQGNAVSGGSYLGGVPHLTRGPEPIDEPEISSAQAEAAPGPGLGPENGPEVYQQEAQPEAHEENHDAASPPEDQYETPISNPEPLPYDIEAPGAPPSAENHGEGQPEEVGGPTVSGKPTPPVKKGKKTPIADEEEDDEEDFEEDEAYVPFLPAKGNKRRQGAVPNLNNFFPMMFSFPGFAGRRGSSSGSPPGVVTAIANSYSTGKGGVASSVASAYGGAPPGKKARRAPTTEE